MLIHSVIKGLKCEISRSKENSPAEMALQTSICTSLLQRMIISFEMFSLNS